MDALRGARRGCLFNFFLLVFIVVGQYNGRLKKNSYSRLERTHVTREMYVPQSSGFIRTKTQRDFSLAMTIAQVHHLPWTWNWVIQGLSLLQGEA